MRDLGKEGARVAESVATPIEKFRRSIQLLNQLLEAGKITQQTYGRAVNELTKDFNATNPAMQRWNKLVEDGARLTKQLRTPLEQYRDTLKEVRALAASGNITPDIQQRAIAKARTDFAAADPAQQQRNALLAEGLKLTQANLTPLEQYNAAILKAGAALAAGAISQETYNREIARAKTAFAATDAAQQQHNKLIADGARLTAAVRSPQEALTASLRSYDAMLKAGAIDQVTFNRAVVQANASFKQATSGTKAFRQDLLGLRGLLIRFTSVYAAFGAVRGILKITDDFKLLENRLTTVTGKTGDLAKTQEALFNVAQRTRQEYASVTDLYIRLAQAGGDLGASQQELVKFTEAVGNSLAISGTSAERARGVLIQLSQGLATGTFRSEEFNSVLEGSPQLIRTVAANIERFGGSVGKLRNAVREGKLASTEFFEAVLRGADKLQKTVGDMPLTISQAFQQLKNVFTKAVLGADLTPLVKSLTDFTKLVKDPKFIENLTAFVNLILKLTGVAVQTAAGIGKITKASVENFKLVTGQLEEYDRLQLAIDRRREHLAATSWLDKDLGFLFLTNEQLEKQIKHLEDLQIPLPFSKGPTNARGAPETIKPIDDTVDKKAKAAQESILKLLETMRQQIAVTGETEEATIRYRIEFGDLVKEFKDAGPAFAKYRDELIKTARQLDQFKAGEELEKANKQLEQQVVEMQAARIEQERGAVAALEYRAAMGELGDTLKLAAQNVDDLTGSTRDLSQIGQLNLAVGVDATQVPLAIREVADQIAAQSIPLKVAADTSQALVALDEFVVSASKTTDTAVSFKVDTTQAVEALYNLTEAERRTLEQLEERKRRTAEVERLTATFAIQDQIKALDAETHSFIANKIAMDQGAVAALQYRIAHGDLKKLFEQLGPAAAEYQKHLEDSTKALELLTEHQAAIDASEQVLPSRTKAAKEYFQVLEGLQIRLQEGKISQKRYNEAVKQAEKNFKDASKVVTEWTVFMDEAARAAQSAFADFLFDPFKDGLEGMVNGFADALRRIAAEIVAAQLSEKLFEGLQEGPGKFDFKSLFGSKPEELLAPILVPTDRLPRKTTDAELEALISGTAATATQLTAAGTAAATSITAAGTTFTTALTAAGTSVSAAITAAGASAAAAIAAAAGASGLSSISLAGFDFSGAGFASGGKVPGPGSRDTVPAWLTPGEFVVRAQAAKNPHILKLLERINEARGYATGGVVEQTVRATAVPYKAMAAQAVPMRAISKRSLLDEEDETIRRSLTERYAQTAETFAQTRNVLAALGEQTDSLTSVRDHAITDVSKVSSVKDVLTSLNERRLSDRDVKTSERQDSDSTEHRSQTILDLSRWTSELSENVATARNILNEQIQSTVQTQATLRSNIDTERDSTHVDQTHSTSLAENIRSVLSSLSERRNVAQDSFETTRNRFATFDDVAAVTRDVTDVSRDATDRSVTYKSQSVTDLLAQANEIRERVATSRQAINVDEVINARNRLTSDTHINQSAYTDQVNQLRSSQREISESLRLDSLKDVANSTSQTFRDTTHRHTDLSAFENNRSLVENVRAASLKESYKTLVDAIDHRSSDSQDFRKVLTSHVGQMASTVSQSDLANYTSLTRHSDVQEIANRLRESTSVESLTDVVRSLSETAKTRSETELVELVRALRQTFSGAVSGGSVPRFAGGGPTDVRPGGMLHGPGTPTSDDMLLWGSTKEFMVRAKAAQQPGAPAFLNAFNTGKIRMETVWAGMEALKVIPKLAMGGFVAPTIPQMAWGGGLVTPAMPNLKEAGVGNTYHMPITIQAPQGTVSQQTLLQTTAAVARGTKLADRRNN